MNVNELIILKKSNQTSREINQHIRFKRLNKQEYEHNPWLKVEKAL